MKISKEEFDVMYAYYIDKKSILLKLEDSPTFVFSPTTNPIESWDWNNYNYAVKPEPVTVQIEENILMDIRSVLEQAISVVESYDDLQGLSQKASDLEDQIGELESDARSLRQTVDNLEDPNSFDSYYAKTQVDHITELLGGDS